MKNIKTICAGMFCIYLTLPAVAKAGGFVEADPKKTIFVTVSANDMNRIEMPEAVVNGLTSKDMDIHIDGKNVFVKLSAPARAGELFVITESGIQSFILVPKDVPAETIIVKDKYEAVKTPDGMLLKADDYEGRIKSLMLALYHETAGGGYGRARTEERAAEEMLDGLVLKKTYTIEGEGFEGVKYEIHNTGESVQSLREEMFASWGVAISVDKNELRPGEKGRVMVIKGASYGN